MFWNAFLLSPVKSRFSNASQIFGKCPQIYYFCFVWFDFIMFFLVFRLWRLHTATSPSDGAQERWSPIWLGVSGIQNPQRGCEWWSSDGVAVRGFAGFCAGRVWFLMGRGRRLLFGLKRGVAAWHGRGIKFAFKNIITHHVNYNFFCSICFAFFFCFVSFRLDIFACFFFNVLCFCFSLAYICTCTNNAIDTHLYKLYYIMVKFFCSFLFLSLFVVNFIWSAYFFCFYFVLFSFVWQQISRYFLALSLRSVSDTRYTIIYVCN